ncbi:hypothetical protein HMPREF0987_00539 [Lachnospiraceae bacterium 9_1_43BFAA]|nr:hypothetical protein HMPREF0987_00539 [Lachnospiraceae bacterium 9_1_43BFAA]
MSVIPKIRFKGFTDAWEQRKLGDVLEVIKDGTHGTHQDAEDGPFLLSAKNIKNGVIIWDETDRKISEDEYEKIHSKFKLQNNDVLLTIVGSIGETAILKDISGITFQRSVAFLRPSEELSSEFLYSEIQTPKFQKELDCRKSTSAQPGIYLGDLSEIPFAYSKDKDEQKKIGEYFLNIDNLLTLHQRKCDETKELKKYMLQKMFPKKGEKVPEIRFKGFTDAWEQRKFSECYKMTSGYAFKMSDYCDTGVGLINGESIQHGIINDDNLNYLPESFIQQYSEFLLKESDIVVGLNRPITNGNLKIARIPSKYNNSLLYQRAGKIVYKIDCDKNFTYVLLSQEILKHTLVEAVGSDQPFISTSKLDNWKMMMPSDMEEQEKIGLYFTSLDHLITLHQRKCDSLKELKKYMLQNMFPKEG